MDLGTRTGFEFSPHTISLTLLACGFMSRACASETESLCRLESIVSNVWNVLHGQHPEQCLDFLKSDRVMNTDYIQCHNNKLFVTEAGQLCLGPGGVREGDKVVRLLGLDLPSLLRPEQSWYTFAGVAYIDVEFPDAQGTSTRTPEVYEIR